MLKNEDGKAFSAPINKIPNTLCVTLDDKDFLKIYYAKTQEIISSAKGGNLSKVTATLATIDPYDFKNNQNFDDDINDLSLNHTIESPLLGDL